MGVRKGTWGICLALAAIGVAHANVIGLPRAEFQHLYSLGPNGRVTIQNLYGDVRITVWNRDEVLVEATKRAADAKQLDDAQVVVEPGSGLLSIYTRYAGVDARRPASVEYRITVPRTANL